MAEGSTSGYGTLSEGSTNHNGGQKHGPDDEESTLLPKAKKDRFFWKRLQLHLGATVTNTYGDIALLFCYIITGLLDSSSVYTWGSFVSMQTGNTVYLGSGVVAPGEGNKWLRALISIAFFCLGSFSFSRFHRIFGGRTRWVLVLSYVIQLILTTTAAVMVTLGPRATPEGPLTVWIAVPLALIAFQSAGQAYVSRVLKYGSLTSAVLTSIYLDLFSDPSLFAGITQNAERNRRAAAPLLLLAGAVLGGLWAHSPIGLTGALWTAVVLKFFVIVAWSFWAAEKQQE